MYGAYKGAARRALFSWGSGFRMSRFMDLTNLVLEAPRCDVDFPYAHQLYYGRYHHDGSEWRLEEYSRNGSPDSSECGCEIRECGPFDSGVPPASCGRFDVHPETNRRPPSEGGSSHSNSRGSKTPDVGSLEVRCPSA